MPNLVDIASLMDGKLIIAVGDITQYKGDAIVNAANSSLLGGGGVDGAIHRAAGTILLEECKKMRMTLYKDGLSPGSAVATKAGNLDCRIIIHTVGPVWKNGNAGEPQILESCYNECLRIALDSKCKDIAFPAIATGIYGFPKEKSAIIVKRLITKFFEEHLLPEKITLVFFTKNDADIFLKAS